MEDLLFKELIQWSRAHYSQLPWRKERSLYGTLVSEIMLQQTTVGTVLNHYQKFLEKYPTINHLASASEEEVCVAWRGLGYYRRARNLRNLAIQIVEKFKGHIPSNVEELMKLKGIGPYTANAIVAIGADQKGLAVDANLERVLARFYGYQENKGAKLQAKILKDFLEQKILKNIVELGPRTINEALMDLGRVICQARKASCAICPLSKDCHASQDGNPEKFPFSAINQKAVEHELHLLRIVVREKNKILFYQKDENEWLAGQWELPTFVLHSSDDKLQQYPVKNYPHYDQLLSYKTGITRYKISNYILEMNKKDFDKILEKDQRNFSFKVNRESLNLSTASIKALKLIEKESK